MAQGGALQPSPARRSPGTETREAECCSGDVEPEAETRDGALQWRVARRSAGAESRNRRTRNPETRTVEPMRTWHPERTRNREPNPEPRTPAPGTTAYLRICLAIVCSCRFDVPS